MKKNNPGARQINKHHFLGYVFVFILMILAILSRYLPHPPNFTPVAAVALFGGVLLPRKFATFVPALIMIASDLIIGLHGLVLFTWGSYLLIGWLASITYRGKISAKWVVGGAIGSGIVFFVITNFGVWLEGMLYPRNLSGLVDAYVMALPFFRNTLLGNLIYSGMLFGAYSFSLRSWGQGILPSKQLASEAKTYDL